MKHIRTTALDFFAHESITVSSSSIGLTAATARKTNGTSAQHALITIETDDIRVYFDGTAADSSGHLFNDGDVIEIWGSNAIANFRAIRVTNDATLRVSYA